MQLFVDQLCSKLVFQLKAAAILNLAPTDPGQTPRLQAVRIYNNENRVMPEYSACR